MKFKGMVLLVTVLVSGSALGQHAFLVDYFGPDGNLVTLQLDDPSEETVIGPAVAFLGDAEFGPDNILYALPYSGTEFYQIDTTTAVVTQTGISTPLPNHSWTGLAYDFASGLLCASSSDGNYGAFYIIDATTGTATQIGTTTEDLAVVDIAFDAGGQLYAHCLPGSFYQVDKNTGVATYIGDTGIQGAGSWHGLDYCYENETMYMATYNSISMINTLRTVDLTTGATTEVGTMDRGAGGFAITSPVQGIDETVSQESSVGLSVSPSPASGSITMEVVLSDPAVAELSIIDVTGRLVHRIDPGQLLQGEHSFVWNGQDQNGALVENGVYFVRLATGGTETATARIVVVR